jgi:hypothetical protein
VTTSIFFFKNAMPLDWQNIYESSGQTFDSLLQMTPYFERIETEEKTKEILSINIVKRMTAKMKKV